MDTQDAQPAPTNLVEAAHPGRSASPGLLEALIALSIVISLSGVVMPLVGTEVQSQRLQSAWADMQAIGDGLAAFTRDTRYLPTGVQGRTNLGWLYGPGAIPSHNAFASLGEARELGDALLQPALGGPAWDGPYADDAALGPDPWGQAYIVHADGWISGRRNPFVVSAGPDGVLQTGPADRAALGDDLIYVLP